MSDRRRWLSGLATGLLLALSGCAAADKPLSSDSTVASGKSSEAPTKPASADGLEISLHRGPCFGRCPQYSVRIDASGLVSFAGERNVAALGEAQGQADPARLAVLVEMLRGPELATVQDIYRPGQPGCGPVATDMPNSRIEWQLDGRRHSINYYRGCSGAPEALRQLPAAIDAAAGTQVWIRDGVDR